MPGAPIILALLALAGGALSFYFLQVYRGKLPADVWWVPSVCRVGRSACQSIVDTPYGRTFGRPNAFWGCLFYPFLLVIVAITFGMNLEPTFLLIFSVAIVTVSAYLSWGLIRLKAVCRVCIAVHILNVLFLGVVLVVLRV